MIPANRLSTPIKCQYCNKVIAYPTVVQKYCNQVCRDKQNHPRTGKREWFKPRRKVKNVSDKTIHSIKGVDFSSHNVIGPNTIGDGVEKENVKLWHEPDDWPDRESAGKPICPRCGTFLARNEVKYCRWCVKDRARFLEMQNGKS